MRLIADEHVARTIIRALEADGHDMLPIARDASGFDDVDVVDLALRTGRGIVSYDRDYGDIVYQGVRSAPVTILYVRIDHREIDLIARRLIAVLRTIEVVGQMVVVEPDGVRVRALPKSAEETDNG